MKYLIALSLMLATSLASAQSSLSSRLLREVAAEQVRVDSFYFAGMFPSYRHYGHPGGKMKEDNNIFFTGLIAMTLTELQTKFRGEDSLLCQQIIQSARPSFQHFQHRSKRHTYNFWRTSPAMVFPNSWFLNMFTKQHALPDDIDDTVILLMAMEAEDSIATRTKRMMEQHANTVHYPIRNTFEKYRQIPAYSTWFGTKMPVDFDFCVLSNALYFAHLYDLADSKHDTATVQLLASFIREREYMSHARYISPHYARSPILIYHAARLMHRFPIPALLPYREQLIADAKTLWETTHDPMDKVLLSTSLGWLGAEMPVLAIAPEQADGPFIFFVAGFNSLLPDRLKQGFSGYPPISYYFRCPAYNKILMLQHLLLREETKVIL